VPTRFKALSPSEMTPEQVDARDTWARGRGAVGGPVNLLLRSPNLAKALECVGAHLRFNNALPQIVARAWTVQFEWQIHSTLALQAGLSATICEAVSLGKRPLEMADEEAAIFNFVVGLLGSGRVSDDVFDAVRSRFGDAAIADLIALVGYYCIISFVLNVDQQPLTGDGVPLTIIATGVRPADASSDIPILSRD
jgi:4-carboxymuconolactone decarboxylase